MTKFKDPTAGAAIERAHKWWRGIDDGNIQFVKGLPLIEEYVPAFIPTHIILVTGYTSAGKSKLISQMIDHTAGDENEPTLVFSLEDSQEEKLFSIAAIRSRVHPKKMMLGTMNDEERQRVNAAFDQISTWPLHIYDDVRHLTDMKDIIKKVKPKVVVMDYIQKVQAPGKLYDRMAHAADETYWMAREPGCEFTFVIASQIDGQSAREDKGVFIASKGAGDLVEAAHSANTLRARWSPRTSASISSGTV